MKQRTERKRERDDVQLMQNITVAVVTLSWVLMPVWPVLIYCTQCEWCKHRHWSYKVGGRGGQCIKRRPRCFGVCQFINKMADGWGGSRRGRCFSTEILTNNKNNNKKSTQKKKRPQLKSEHFIIYTQYIFPSSAFWFLESFFPCFDFPFLVFLFYFWCAFGIKAKWTLVASVKCESLLLKKKRRMFTSLLGADSVVEK